MRTILLKSFLSISLLCLWLGAMANTMDNADNVDPGLRTIAFESSTVQVDKHGIPTSVTFYYDVPEGMSLSVKSTAGGKGSLYTAGIDIPYDYANKQAQVVESGRAIRWTLSKTSWMPLTEYEFRKDGSTLEVVDASGAIQAGFVGQDAAVTFTTVSREDAGFNPMELEFTVNQSALANGVQYAPEMSVDKLSSIFFRHKDYFYYMDGVKCNLRSYASATRPDWSKDAEVYEITPDGDVLLTTVKFGTSNVSSHNWAGSVPGCIYPNIYLYEGKKYRVIVPEGCFTAQPDNNSTGQGLGAEYDKTKIYYIRNPRMEFTFTGATPEKAQLDYCNVQNGSSYDALYKFIIGFKDKFNVVDGAHIVLSRKNSSGEVVETSAYPFKVLDGIDTKLTLDLVDKFTGCPLVLEKNYTYSFTLPSASVISDANDKITNDEIVISVTGTGNYPSAAPSEVDVNMVLGGRQTSFTSVKGKTLSIEMAPENGWKVTSVTNNGSKLLNVGNRWNTFPLNADANIVGNIEYSGTWATELTPDSWEIEDAGITINRENDQIVIKGVSPDKTISVYTKNGNLINTITTEPDKDSVRISLSSGATYLVLVDGIATEITLPANAENTDAPASESDSASKAVLLECNVIDNSKRSQIHNVVWTFDGIYRWAEDATILLEGIPANPVTIISPSTHTPIITHRDGKTAVMIDHVTDVYGSPLYIGTNITRIYTISPGTLINVENGEIVNDEIKLTVHNLADASEATGVCNVKIIEGDRNVITHTAVQGKAYAFDIKPEAGWKLTEVTADGVPLQRHKGLWYTKPLSKDTEVKAHLEYAGPWAVEVSTGVWQVENTAILIHRDNDRIAVTGAPAGCVINVYTVGGTLIDSRRAESSDVRIPVAPGQTYIVTVDGTAAKLRM